MSGLLEEKYNGAVFDKGSRSLKIIRTGRIAIGVDLVLAFLKALVGLMSGSIAIVLDAVNNISDLAASIITIMGTKIASKSPDREHPFGHGRIEYISAMIISVIILYIGVMSLWESMKKIFEGDSPNYNMTTLIIVAMAVVGKFLLGRFVKKRGRELNSSALVNSGQDSLLDALISLSTLLAAIIFLTTSISLEAYLGVVISLVIVKSGVDMVKEAIYSILGDRVDVSLIKSIKETVCSFEKVYDACDMVFNNYGPNSYMGALHIEVPDTCTVDELDRLARDITKKVYEEYSVVLYAIGAYPVNMRDENAIKARNDVKGILDKYKNVLEMHGFYYNEKEKKIRFDMVVSFEENAKENLHKRVHNCISERYPGYEVEIAIDTDFSVS